MKTYEVNVKLYVPAENDGELNSVLENMSITNSEYYGSHCIENVEVSEED